MSYNRLNLVGQQCNRLEVIEFVGTNKYSKSLWLCKCACGNYITILGSQLLNGRTKSCGCLKQEVLFERNFKHGNSRRESKSREYISWCNMKARCLNPLVSDYKNYGGRGIAVCDKWLGKDGFSSFLIDMGSCPKQYTIERVDNDGPYSPENCLWIAKQEQVNNTRNNRLMTLGGDIVTVTQAAQKIGISVGTLSARINKCGWSEEKALNTPLRGRRQA